jgi:uncharacterized protein (TIGR02217 family)
MSDVVYPVLPGLQYPIGRSPRWDTDRVFSRSGRRFASTQWTYPIWVYRLSYEFLRRSGGDAELDALVGFFNQVRGSWDTFLFADPDDNAVAAQTIGIGDGVNRDFALVRTIGAFAEPIGARNGAITVTANGAATTAYVLIENRIVRMNTAPANGVVMRWTGSYHMRCVFTEDRMNLEKFMSHLWSGEAVEFETWKA